MQPSRGILRKRFSENMQQIYKTTPMLKRESMGAINLLHILRTPFPRNTSGWMLLLFINVLNWYWLFLGNSVKSNLYKKWSFPLRISSVNVTKSSGNCGYTFTEEILNGKLAKFLVFPLVSFVINSYLFICFCICSSSGDSFLCWLW